MNDDERLTAYGKRVFFWRFLQWIQNGNREMNLLKILKVGLSWVVLLCLFASAQNLGQDFQLIAETLPRDTSLKELKKEPASTAPHRFLFAIPIRLYQTVVSSQDAPSCNFYPSCSHFGMDAIRKAGFIKGTLLTSDRLQRCNGIPGIQEFYPGPLVDHRFVDPVARYLFREEH